MVYLVINFKNSTDNELGDCKCSAQTPESGDVIECMYVVVDTEYHHHVLSDGGLGVVFVVDFLRWLVFGLLVS